MRNYLLFQLYGPMQSWGEIAVGEVRGSAAHPTKSAIIGLLAASLGIRREREQDKDHQKLFDALYFAVRVDSVGALLRDYHTSQVPSTGSRVNHSTRKSELAGKDPGTILSNRDYRCDAVYTVALWAKEEFDLERLKSALLHPIFTLSLGRKSCPPALPLRPIICSANNLVEAFSSFKYPSELKTLLPKPREVVNVYWEGNDTGLVAVHDNHRRDGITYRSRWQFADRIESYGTIEINEGKEV